MPHHTTASMYSRCLHWLCRRAQLSAPVLAAYSGVCVFMVVIGVWLAVDLVQGRNHIIASRSHMAVQKSQMIGALWSQTFLAAGYVLGDVVDRVSDKDLLYPDPDPRHAKQMEALLTQKITMAPGITGLGLYNNRCTLTARANGKAPGYQGSETLCQARKRLRGTDIHTQYLQAEESASGRPVVSVSRNLVSPQGRFLGGAVASIDLSQAQHWLAGFAIEQDDVMAIADQHGVWLARNPAMPEIIGKTTKDPTLLPIFAALAPTATVATRSPNDQRERIYGISKVEGVPLLVIVGFDRANALQDWQRRAWQLSGGFIALLALALLTAHAHMAALRQREVMHKLATTDALTGLANRRCLLGIAAIETIRTRRHRLPLSVLMIDIDHFKVVNDTWGHPAGDRVLQALAQIMAQTARQIDTVGRLGGEEFAMLLPETDVWGAQALAERLRVKVENARTLVNDDDAVVTFTISIGVATMVAETETFEHLLARADKALYCAKESGRNRVVVCSTWVA